MQRYISTFFSKRKEPDSSSKEVNPTPKRKDSLAGSEDEDISWEREIESDREESDSEEEPTTHSLSGPSESEATALVVPCSAKFHKEPTCFKIPGAKDISQGKTESPAQPQLSSFPLRQIGNRLRSFGSSWYSNHKWLEYSVLEDAAYCFCCRHFSPARKMPEAAFVSTGFRQWKKATEKDAGLSKHEKSEIHKESMVAWKDFQTRVKSEQTIEKVSTSATEKTCSRQPLLYERTGQSTLSNRSTENCSKESQ